MDSSRIFDLLVIGGGINGAGIARDAAGRGMAVALVESGDLGGATSSASTKLIHGGLRYLEFGAFGLVRKALAEREVILDMAPHISWPQSFVLPLGQGARPGWQVRAGLMLYDRLARRVAVPGSARINLHDDRAGRALADRDATAFRYWDGWIDDSRLVIANCRDAAARGATILPRCGLVSARFTDGLWQATLANGQKLAAHHIVNAAGPWAGEVAARVLGLADAPALRLVQGTHIVTRRVHLGRDAFMLQQPDGRIIFVLPYERDFSLIGTTERTIDRPDAAAATDAEVDYLLEAANRWLARPLKPDDVIQRFAGIRPLVLEPGKDERETTRDWRFVSHHGVPATTVVGGKITTYRRLAEALLQHLPGRSRPWTEKAPLPGGEVPREKGEHGQAAFRRWLETLIATNPDYDPRLIRRLAQALGTDVMPMLAAGLGARVGGLWEAELRHYRDHEWARSAEDVLWRRTRMGLHLTAAERADVARWFGEAPEHLPEQPELPLTHRFAQPGAA
jgi:glycerol-3-phosphate dehydrogenase